VATPWSAVGRAGHEPVDVAQHIGAHLREPLGIDGTDAGVLVEVCEVRDLVVHRPVRCGGRSEPARVVERAHERVEHRGLREQIVAE